VDYDDPTPAGVTREIWRWFPAWMNALIVIAVLCGALTLAGHAFGWWLSAQDATHQAQNTQNGYANQTTLRQQVTSQLAQSEQVSTQIAGNGTDAALITQLKVQRAAIDGQVCSDAAEITGTPLPAQQAAWVTVNCLNGTLSPKSPEYVTGAP
jgi:hypothetical protein